MANLWTHCKSLIPTKSLMGIYLVLDILHTQKSARAKVIHVIERILAGQSLSVLLDELLAVVGDDDRGFAHELTVGTLRQWWALSRIGESLIERQPTDRGVSVALNVGLYQLLYMSTPDYAAINATLDALKELNKGYGVGLVNAILRKVANNPAKFAKKVQKNHSLPNHLAKILKSDWQTHYEILSQNLRQPAPIFLRVNTKFGTPDDYATRLNHANIACDVVPVGVRDERCIVLKDNIKIKDLPDFCEGYVSVQDRHAQIAGHLLASLRLPKHPNILDACTAPGGKLAQILELSHSGAFDIKHMTALDSDDRRLDRVHKNLARLHLGDKADVICADATTYQADIPFDVIVLDAPCTATGVIRRHPDIALLRTENDIIETVKLQAQILANLWQSLAVGGYLLYITCSLIKAENTAQISNFLTNTPNARAVDIELTLPNHIKQSVGYQCLPLDKYDGDGFYYALLQKI
ncbi:16S rRNA (cytosine(967)-C(5))-methyltransferase RsmB [Moraxella nasovis]|uniref:16S rRNA (cytosine(967)-C(5))-methyltransferase RsmB n=1 Tax=Moraxella nasovis TaxID=2904121 RepID=UPI001F60F886|nr:16S rRNA (cytosine(967)-C(5))-methyltransferase RsmB [Moraxella nasovis]UNU72500.1 16S rRNA (cytosine(967)-C(5))-methyltransferase RsmB [Moraxella nasovis]